MKQCLPVSRCDLRHRLLRKINLFLLSYCFRRVRKTIANSDYWLSHVCPFLWGRMFPAGRIVVEFNIL